MALTSWSSSDPEKDLSGDVSTLERDTAVLCANLAHFNAEYAKLETRRTLQIAELASLLSLPENSSARDALSDFTETVFRVGDDKNANTDLVRFCKELTRRGYSTAREGHSEDLFGYGHPVSMKASERVAYLQNRFTDTAFLRLTAHLAKPRAAYFSSFSGICEEVYHGLCEFCILPVESSDGGKLLRFYALIEKFDLKIVTVCDVEEANGAFTRYALLRHKYIALHPPRGAIGERFAEFSLVLNDRLSLTDVLSAASLCEMRLSRADSLPLPYREHDYRYGLVFSLPQGDETPAHIEAFLLYLSVSLPEYTPLGIYTKVL